jgi:hypothetical protein
MGDDPETLRLLRAIHSHLKLIGWFVILGLFGFMLAFSDRIMAGFQKGYVEPLARIFSN